MASSSRNIIKVKGNSGGKSRVFNMNNRDRVVLAAFLTEALLAGGSGVAIRFSNRELAPLWGASLRFSLAAALIVIIMIGLRLALPRGRALLGSLLFGFFQVAGAFGLYHYALVQMHAGLGQTVLALVPLATLLLAVAQHQERLRRTAVVGTLLALIGVGLISRDPLRESVPLLSLLAVLGSVLCFAEALVLVRRFPPVHPVAMNAVGMVAGAMILVIASVVAGEPLVLPQRLATWLALGYVAAIGSVVVFLLYVYVVQHWTASRASYVMVLIPFVAVTLSAWLDQEPITGSLVLGGLLILAGVYVGALRPVQDSPTPAEDVTAR
jgi:drug/metabolite transporter (DMT)-like permease